VHRQIPVSSPEPSLSAALCFFPRDPAIGGSTHSAPDGLQTHTAAERSEAVMAAYNKAFTGFSNAEMAILDGILLEHAAKRR